MKPSPNFNINNLHLKKMKSLCLYLLAKWVLLLRLSRNLHLLNSQRGETRACPLIVMKNLHQDINVRSYFLLRWVGRMSIEKDPLRTRDDFKGERSVTYQPPYQIVLRTSCHIRFGTCIWICLGVYLYLSYWLLSNISGICYLLG